MAAPVTAACSLCGEPLDDGRPWQLGLDGGGAHHECLEKARHDDEEEEQHAGE